MIRRLRIGLTGGIASGKTTVAQRFLELGVPVVDADESARAVVIPGTPALAHIIQRFGSAVLLENGELDRKAVRKIIFADPVRRRELEWILHPHISSDMERRADAALGPYLIMAIPLLIEGGLTKWVDRILVIDVPENIQRDRVMARDSVSADQADAIFAAQASRENRLRAADDVLLNSGSLSELREAVDHLHDQYLTLAAASGPN